MGDNLAGIASEKVARGIRALVCDVSKAMLSVSKIVSARSRVVFDLGGPFMEDTATNELRWMQEDIGM